MFLNQETCIGCEICVPYCPVGAIYMQDKLAYIDRQQCTECGNCARPGVVRCPGKCFVEEPEAYDWPRSIRKFFSDPMATHSETGIPGRGTEESKTNDVTGRVRRHEVGVGIELGRPGVAVWGRDIDLMTRALAAAGVHFEASNPLTHLMADPATGTCKPELLDSHLISGIVEFTIPRSDLYRILGVVMETAKQLDSVFSLDLVTQFDDRGQIPDFPELRKFDLVPRPNAKINVGLGRPLFEEDVR